MSALLSALHVVRDHGQALLQNRAPKRVVRARVSRRNAGEQLERASEIRGVLIPPRISDLIAKAAGYAPSSIYSYFKDQHELFFAIRSGDMAEVVEAQVRIAAAEPDPELRLKRIFLHAVDHWIANPEHFDVLFGVRSGSPEAAEKDERFAHSPIVRRSYKVYQDAVETFIATLAKAPDLKSSTDSLIASTHGIIAFTRRTASLNWTDTRVLVESVMEAHISQWKQQDGI